MHTVGVALISLVWPVRMMRTWLDVLRDGMRPGIADYEVVGGANGGHKQRIDQSHLSRQKRKSTSRKDVKKTLISQRRDREAASKMEISRQASGFLR